jgi:hypothetical protein
LAAATARRALRPLAGAAVRGRSEAPLATQLRALRDADIICEAISVRQQARPPSMASVTVSGWSVRSAPEIGELVRVRGREKRVGGGCAKTRRSALKRASDQLGTEEGTRDCGPSRLTRVWKRPRVREVKSRLRWVTTGTAEDGDRGESGRGECVAPVAS